MVENVIQIKSETTIYADVRAKIQENNMCAKKITLPSRIDMTSRQ